MHKFFWLIIIVNVVYHGGGWALREIRDTARFNNTMKNSMVSEEDYRMSRIVQDKKIKKDTAIKLFKGKNTKLYFSVPSYKDNIDKVVINVTTDTNYSKKLFLSNNETEMEIPSNTKKLSIRTIHRIANGSTLYMVIRSDAGSVNYVDIFYAKTALNTNY